LLLCLPLHDPDLHQCRYPVTHVDQAALLQATDGREHFFNDVQDLLRARGDDLGEVEGVGGEGQDAVEAHVDLLRVVQDLQEHHVQLTQGLKGLAREVEVQLGASSREGLKEVGGQDTEHVLQRLVGRVLPLGGLNRSISRPRCSGFHSESR